jgi:predicted nucleotidyltransferase
MPELSLNRETIECIKQEATGMLKELLKEDLVKVILYGSCARGDYSADSDIDIALITKSNRMEALQYNSGLAAIATELAMRHFAVVNFVCLPYEEFLEKKSWYAYFKNIDMEGEVLYG